MRYLIEEGWGHFWGFFEIFNPNGSCFILLQICRPFSAFFEAHARERYVQKILQSKRLRI